MPRTRSVLCAPVLVAVLLVASAGLVSARDDDATRFIRLPNIQVTPTNPSSFDISWVDNRTGLYFLADRTNNAVDLFNARNDTFRGPIGHGLFTGNVAASACPTGGNTCSGPDGVLTDNQGRVWAGDGNSTVKVFRAPDRATAASSLLADIATGGKARADELSYDARDQRILIANDAEGFLAFLNVNTLSVATHFFYADNTVGATPSVPGLSTPGGGIEQSVFVRKTGLFYQALPANSPSTVGAIDVFTPAGQFVTRFSIPGCDNGPTGLAFDGDERFLGACDNGAVAVDLRGRVRKIVQGVGGADEIWFNPGDHNFYLGIGGTAGVANSDKLGVVNKDDKVVTVIAGVGGHSVAAFAGNNHIFDPDLVRTADPANNPARGIAVFASRQDEDRDRGRDHD